MDSFHLYASLLSMIGTTVAIILGFVTAVIQIRNVKHSSLKEKRDKLWSGATNLLNDLGQMRDAYSYYEENKRRVQKSLYDSLQNSVCEVVSYNLKITHIEDMRLIEAVRIFSSKASQIDYDNFVLRIFQKWKHRQPSIKDFSVGMLLVFLESVQSLLDTVMSSDDISSKDKRACALSILSSLTEEEMYALMLFGTHSENKGVKEALDESAISPYLLPNRYQADVVTSIILARFYRISL